MCPFINRPSAAEHLLCPVRGAFRSGKFIVPLSNLGRELKRRFNWLCFVFILFLFLFTGGGGRGFVFFFFFFFSQFLCLSEYLITRVLIVVMFVNYFNVLKIVKTDICLKPREYTCIMSQSLPHTSTPSAPHPNHAPASSKTTMVSSLRLQVVDI